MSFGGMSLSQLQDYVNGTRGTNIVKVRCDTCHHTFDAVLTRKKRAAHHQRPRQCPKCKSWDAHHIE